MKGVDVISEELNQRVERTLERNKALIKRTREDSRRHRREIERSALIVERAIRQLRQGS